MERTEVTTKTRNGKATFMPDIRREVVHRCETCNHYDIKQVLLPSCPIMKDQPDMDMAMRCVAFYIIGLVGCDSWEKRVYQI